MSHSASFIASFTEGLVTFCLSYIQNVYWIFYFIILFLFGGRIAPFSLLVYRLSWGLWTFSCQESNVILFMFFKTLFFRRQVNLSRLSSFMISFPDFHGDVRDVSSRNNSTLCSVFLNISNPFMVGTFLVTDKNVCIKYSFTKYCILSDCFRGKFLFYSLSFGKERGGGW